MHSCIVLDSQYVLLANVVTAPKRTHSTQLTYQGCFSDSRIKVHCEEVAEVNDILVFEMKGRKLDNKDFFGKSDPFVVISRSQEGGQFVPVYKSERIKNTLNPNWPKFQISMVDLCNGDAYRPLRYGFLPMPHVHCS
jgi:Ca2+-dependent lipid-binding protein